MFRTIIQEVVEAMFSFAIPAAIVVIAVAVLS